MRLRGTKLSSIAQSGGLGNQLWDLASSRPSLDLQFADTKSLVDATTGQNLVTFSRASDATYVDSQGVIRNATTNLNTNSEAFNTYTTASGSVVADQGIAPNGTLTADELTSTGGGVFKSIGGLTSGATYVISVYAKYISGGTSFLFGFDANPSSGRAVFNLQTGAFVSAEANVSSYSITPVGNGWHRVTVTAVATSTSAVFVFYNGTSGSKWLLWGAQLEESSTVGEYIPTTSTINSAPRFDHNPETGESLGLLVEEARTNSIRNNTMVGAVAGTPGTLPTSWPYGVAGTGLTRQIVGTGIENGVNYIDIKISGTSGSTAALALAVDRASALTGQSWAGSTYVKLVGGSTTGVTGWDVVFIEETSAFVGVTSGSFSLGIPSSTLTRVSGVRTLSGGATVASLLMRIDVSCTNGAAIDFTLRIGLPQLEQGAFATSVIPTTGTAATRAADVASITGTNFSSWYNQSEGTVFAEITPRGIAAQNYAYAIDLANSFANSHLLYAVNGSPRAETFVGSVIQAQITSNLLVIGQVRRFANIYRLNDFALASNGALSGTDVSGSLPAPTSLKIGTSAGGISPLNGTLKRLTFWPQRLSNAVLQSITQ